MPNKKAITLQSLKNMSLEEIKSQSSKCIIQIGGKVTPEIGLKIIEMIESRKLTAGEFLRNLIERFFNGANKTESLKKEQKPDKKAEIPEYYKVLQELFEELINNHGNALLKAMQSINVSPQRLNELQEEASQE